MVSITKLDKMVIFLFDKIYDACNYAAMTKINDVINELGGRIRVAETLNLNYQAVCKWCYRNSIPSNYWPDLIKNYPKFLPLITKGNNPNEIA